MCKPTIHFIRMLSALCFIVRNIEASPDAGVKATVTEKLLREILDEEIKRIETDLVGKTFPDLSGKSGDLEYSIWNMRVTSLDGMTSHLDLRSPRTVYWTGGIGSISVKANYRVKYKILFAKLSLSGTVTARGRGISMSLSISLSAQNGRLAVGLNRCSANVNKLDLNFSGNLFSWILDILSDLFEGTVKDELEEAICKAVKNEFEVLSQDVYKIDNRFNIKMIGVPLTLDAGFVDISVTNHDITVMSKGDILWHGTKFDPENTNVPFMTPSKMGLSIGLKTDTVNNFLAALTEAQALDGELSYEELKTRNLIFLQLHCPGDLCIGNAFKKIASEFPGRYLGMHWSIKQGRLEVGPNEMLGRLAGRVFFNAEDKYNSTYLFSGSVNITVHFQARFTGERITIKAVGLGGLIQIDESLIGKVLSTNVQTLTTMFILPALRKQLLQIINDYDTDYRIPLPQHMSFKQSMLSFHQGLIQIDADICYRKFCVFTGNSSYVGKTTTQNFDVQDILPEPSTTTTTTTLKPSTTTQIPVDQQHNDNGISDNLQDSNTSGQIIYSSSYLLVSLLQVSVISLKLDCS